MRRSSPISKLRRRVQNQRRKRLDFEIEKKILKSKEKKARLRDQA
jgi:hypothetical protein